MRSGLHGSLIMFVLPLQKLTEPVIEIRFGGLRQPFIARVIDSEIAQKDFQRVLLRDLRQPPRNDGDVEWVRLKAVVFQELVIRGPTRLLCGWRQSTHL